VGDEQALASVRERGACDAADQERLHRALARRAQRNQVGVPLIRQLQNFCARLPVQQGGFCGDALCLQLLLGGGEARLQGFGLRLHRLQIRLL
jgi:signal-transduction protein with cAMP-binding, CBS, and nucleotidyltransferase domain